MPTPPVTTRPVEIGYRRVLGQRVRVARWPGDPHRPPLLMLNGICARLDLLTPLAEALTGREVVTFEFPGAGESAPARIPYTMPMAGAFTARLLSALDLKRVDVFGVSWGGLLAQQFALQFPRRCRKLVLAATFAGAPSLPGRLSVLRELSTPRRFNDPVHRRRVAPTLYGGTARSSDVVEDLDRRYGRTRPTSYFLQQLAVTGWSSQPLLWALRQPTLVMAGDDDPIIPLKNAQWMAKLIPHSTLHVVSDGHLFFLSDAVGTAATMTAFLDGPEAT